jgi:hypothetical protein
MCLSGVGPLGALSLSLLFLVPAEFWSLHLAVTVKLLESCQIRYQADRAFDFEEWESQKVWDGL